MATKIIHKKSSSASSVPVAGDLEPGELAVNLADKKLYSKTVGGTVIELGNNPMSGAAIKTAYEGEANAYTDTKNTKLGAIEDNATADQSDAEIAAAYAVINDQVSAGEITAGTESTLRTYAPDDIKAFIDQHGGSGSTDATYEAPVADLTALSALAESGLIDRERRFVDAELADYFYDLSVGTGDLAPDDQTGGTGFWMRAASATSPLSTSKAYHTAGTTITASDTVISLGGESFDTGNYHDNSTNNSRHTVAVSDYYMISGQLTYNASISHLFTMILIRKNGSTIIAKIQWTRATDNSTFFSIGISTGVVWLDAGDYVEMMAASAPDGTLNTGANGTWMTIVRMNNGGATMTGAEIKTAYEAETNAYTDALNTKLGNIETLADVTDTTNVTAAGAAMLGGAGITVGGAHFNPQSGSTYTLVAGDNGKTIMFTGANVVTVPSGLGQGFRCTLLQLGSGQVSVVTSGTTVNSLSGLTKCAGQYGVLGLLASGSNVFVLAGDLIA